MKNAIPYSALRLILLAALAFLAPRPARAQLVITSEMYGRQAFTVRGEVRDSLSREAVPFASVYIQPAGDSLITLFALSDSTGKAELHEITRGEYVVNVEFMGYEPWRRRLWVRKDEDLGVLLLKPDREVLDAAKVSAAANPVEIRRDTLIYNAAAFKTLEGDALVDLLKKMPGIEIDQQGNIKVNGQRVSKLTVGGRTFFSGNNAAALNYLPAKVVDKVKVIDRDSDAAQFSGIADEKKEKVMDVQLKEEFKKGLFGNLKLALGTSIPGCEPRPDTEYRPFLYSTSGMASTFTDRDQVTVVGSSMNTREVESAVVFGGDYDEDILKGIGTSSLAGINASTDRVRGMETIATASWQNTSVVRKSGADRTTFQESGGDIHAATEQEANVNRSIFKLGGELKNKKRDRFAFTFEPNIRYNRVDRTGAKSAVTDLEGEERNRSSSQTGVQSGVFSTDGELTFGIKQIGGVKRRALTLTGSYSYEQTAGNSFENSLTTYTGGAPEDRRALLYDSKAHNGRFGGSIQWVEPFGSDWALQAFASSYFRIQDSEKEAFDKMQSAHSDFYSAWADSRYLSNYGRLLLQYKKGDTNIQAGGSVRAITDRRHSRSYGIDTVTGEGEVLWNWAPFLRFKMRWGDNHSLGFRYNGNSERPSQSALMPTFNLSNPTRITAGNIYLKPHFDHGISFEYAGGNTKKQVVFSLDGLVGIGFSPEVEAGWFDGRGIYYSVPVNALRPSLEWSLYPFLSFPLSRDKSLSFQFNSNIFFNRATGYQSVGTGPSVDMETLDYRNFIDNLFGDASGSRFYGGASGFRESLTRSLRVLSNYGITWRGEQLTLRLGGWTTLNQSRYSLNPDANVRTLELSGTFSAVWTTPHKFDVKSSVSYDKTFGYLPAYDFPMVMWHARIAKNWKAWNFNIQMADILNDSHDVFVTQRQDYTENSWEYRPGRRILFGVSWNFGKMNAAHQRKAQGAMWDMMW
jgi:hypothetical protein